ncbi:MAG: hypothetical protein PUC82_02420 [bacterium]|nr:hypothetical protein [bacterium]
MKKNNESIKNNKRKASTKPSSKNSKIKEKSSLITKLIPKTTSEKVLTISFILLLIIVIILGIKTLTLKQNQTKKEKVDLTLPILEKTVNNEFSIDLSSLEQDEIKEYKFMITNYKDDKVLSTDINYQIEVKNNSNSVAIKLYKNKDNQNLLSKDSTTSIIKDNKLSKDKKTEDIYYLIIRRKGEILAKENITIKITSIN